MEENSSNMNLPEEQQSDLDHDKNMVWYQNISLDDAKAFIRNNIQSAARSFIAIGFYLKRIRDGKLYEADGYASVWELASDEYGISKSTASRYMTMNDRFSVDGNSPVIAEPYRDFEKSKLQEMLSLEYDQLEQVTPDMTVQQIRQLRPPKEIPYFELEGQMNLEADFPDVFPEMDDEQMLQAQMLGTQTETFSMKIDDLVGDDGEPQDSAVVIATSQQEVRRCITGKSPYGYCSCCGFDGVQCCLQCEENCNGRCGWIEQKDDAAETQQNLENAAQNASNLETEEKPARQTPIDELDLSIATYNLLRRAGIDTVEQLRAMDEEDLIAVRGMGNRSFAEIKDKLAQEDHIVEVNEMVDSDDSDQEEQTTDLDIARDILERQKRMLITARELPEGNIHRRREEVKTAAFASYVCELDNMLNPPPVPEKQEQPELPEFKNNDQRKAFIDAYATWPLWIHTKETGEKYYRYDLPGGNSIVVKTYRSMLFDYNSAYDLENRYHEGDGREEYYYLVEPKFFYDCKVNRSYLIEVLKDLQKAGDK